MRMSCAWWTIALVAAGVVFATCEPAEASLARNAAGAKNIGDAGRFTLDTAAQLEIEPDAKAWGLETGLQYQLTKRLQGLVETVLFESQRPDAGEAASGVGDTDVTLSWLASASRGPMPSLVLGARVKLPTAGDREIGTGKADYSALFILGNEFGELELSLETEYTTFGQSGDERLRDQFLYTITAEYGVNDFLSVYGEVFGHSAPTALESRTDAALAGIELDIPLGQRAAPYLSFELDTEGVAGARAGVEWSW